MKLFIAYLVLLAIILVWNYCASQNNKRYDEETPNHD